MLPYADADDWLHVRGAKNSQHFGCLERPIDHRLGFSCFKAKVQP
jgi:hypothetical protein